ncbi:MAG: VanZ family protein [Candidatus Acidiferrales bacterium]
MNKKTLARPKHVLAWPVWSNRVLLLALAGIFFLTLYPFRFASRELPVAHASPFLLGGIAKHGLSLDILLNILLFIPFGFGVTGKLRDRRWLRETTFFAAWIAGFVLSYGIEFTQQYIPTRQSRWEDVLTNSTGAIAGFVLFELCGKSLTRWASTVEGALRAVFTLRRAVLVLPVYFAMWFALTVALQKQTSLTNWDSASVLRIGNDSAESARSAWEGSVSRLRVWNRALPNDLARSLTSGETPPGSKSGLLASYDFRAAQPFRDQMQFLSDLSWIPAPPLDSASNGAALDGESWLRSQAPVSNLVESLRKTNQFSIELVCTPADSTGVDSEIVSISSAPDFNDLYVAQQDSKLIFWLRNPITAGHARLAWPIPGTFAAGQHRDILFSYDGSNISVYIDGTKQRVAYELGPGTVLAELIHRVKPAELNGYAFIYDALIFFPAGVLIGISAVPLGWRNLSASLLLTVEFILASWLLDRILWHGSGRPVSLRAILISLTLAAVGILWINADRGSASAGD